VIERRVLVDEFTHVKRQFFGVTLGAIFDRLRDLPRGVAHRASTVVKME
jgi:hypothetical protein